MDDLAHDVLTQHATQVMLDHARAVAEARKVISALRGALETAYTAMEAMEAGAEQVPVVPGYPEWRAKRPALVE